MINPEYIGDILTGEKKIEYRTWSTKHRGDFLIGCTATDVSNPFICAVASLDDVIFDADENLYEWHLSNVRSIKPLPVRGQPRLFECNVDEYEIIDGKNEAAVNAAYDEADSWITKRKPASR